MFVIAKSQISPSLSPPHTTFPCPILTGMQRELELEVALLQDINVCSLCSTTGLRSVLNKMRGGAGLAKLTSCSACRALAAVHQVVGGDDRGGAVRSVPSALWHVGHAVWAGGADNISLAWPCTAGRCSNSTPPLADILSIRIIPCISTGSTPWPPPPGGGSLSSR